MPFEISPIGDTGRGFARAEFKDVYNWSCSIQESSSVVPRLWLGCDATPEGERLDPIDPVSGHHIGGRMHLSRQAAWVLGTMLLYFHDHGELPSEIPTPPDDHDEANLYRD